MVQSNDISTVTEARYKSEIKHTTNTPYLALMGKLWESIVRIFLLNWHCNGISLYQVLKDISSQNVKEYINN